MSGGSLAVAVIFIPVLWHRFFEPSLRRLILELKADFFNLGLRDGEERARQKQSRDDHLTLDVIHMRIEVLCENITEFMEGTRSLLGNIKEDEDEEGDDDTHSQSSVYSDPNDRRVFFPEDIALHGDFERYRFTTQLMLRQRVDELEVGDQGRGGAPMMGIEGQQFLEIPD